MLVHNAKVLPRLRRSSAFKTRIVSLSSPTRNRAEGSIWAPRLVAPFFSDIVSLPFPLASRLSSEVPMNEPTTSTRLDASMSESRVPRRSSLRADSSRFYVIRSSCFVKTRHDLTSRVTNRADLIKRKFVGFVGCARAKLRSLFTRVRTMRLPAQLTADLARLAFVKASLRIVSRQGKS